jgi:polyphenol oxidase
MLEPVTADNLAALDGIAHGFFTRNGGVSEGIYASLNCGLGSKDDPEAVRENRNRVVRHLRAGTVLTAHQVHSPDAVIVDRPWELADRPKADAIVTCVPGIALGVLTADCAPVLFADQHARVVGAAHAGWRGAVSGVLEATLAKMEALGARRDRIQAAVGPCIGPRIYEVGWDFKQQLLATEPAAAEHFHDPAPGARPHFDLPGYVACRLRRASVAIVTSSAHCTYDVHQPFFSFRRSQTRKEADYGRQISAIVLT